MIPRILISVSSDPRVSGRPAEAVRIAAGVGTWRKVEMNLLLRGPAVHGLAEWVDELVDDDNFTRYLPVFEEMKRPVYVEQGFGDPEVLKNSPWKYREIPRSEIAKLYADHHFVMHL